MFENKTNRLRVRVPGAKPVLYRSGPPHGDVDFRARLDGQFEVFWTMEKPPTKGDDRQLTVSRIVVTRTEGPFPEETTFVWE